MPVGFLLFKRFCFSNVGLPAFVLDSAGLLLRVQCDNVWFDLKASVYLIDSILEKIW